MTQENKPEDSTLLKRFASDERAATSVEYALIGVIMAVPLLASLGLIRDQLLSILNSVANAILASLG